MFGLLEIGHDSLYYSINAGGLCNSSIFTVSLI